MEIMGPGASGELVVPTRIHTREDVVRTCAVAGEFATGCSCGLLVDHNYGSQMEPKSTSFCLAAEAEGRACMFNGFVFIPRRIVESHCERAHEHVATQVWSLC